jgi:hypothetical protein
MNRDRLIDVFDITRCCLQFPPRARTHQSFSLELHSGKSKTKQLCLVNEYILFYNCKDLYDFPLSPLHQQRSSASVLSLCFCNALSAAATWKMPCDACRPSAHPTPCFDVQFPLPSPALFLNYQAHRLPWSSARASTPLASSFAFPTASTSRAASAMLHV